MKRIYLDCNILLDWMLGREPYSYFASKIIELTEKKKIVTFLSALTLANTYYILSKELNKRVAEEFLKDASRIFGFLPMDDTIIQRAIGSRCRDFEDDLHYWTAEGNSLDALITRNGKDFPRGNLAVMDAEEFITLFFAENTGF